MKEMIFGYKPFNLPETDSKENRIKRVHFSRKMRLEGTLTFLKARIINPFEEAAKKSYLEEKLEELDEEFKVESSQRPPSTSWKEVYEGILSFLEIRAEDSRAFKQDEVEYIQGVGYTIKLDALTERINKLKEEATSKPGTTPKLIWPKRKKEELVRKVSLPNRDYSEINPEDYNSVLQTKKFCTDAKKEVIDAFEKELIRWFEVNTGYSKDNIPKKEIKHVERTLEIAVGSYIQVQLIREENPEYKEIISSVISKLEAIKQGEPVSIFKHSQIKGHNFVNIGSIKDYLAKDNLEKENLIKVDSRYCIVP